MPNPGAFKGARKEFQLGEKEAYKLGVEGGYTSEALSLIYRRFFKRFPIYVAQVEREPTAEEVAAVDDDAPDPEVHEPDPMAMSEQEYQQAMQNLKNRRDEIAFKKGQIKRWLAYQYMKDHDADPKNMGTQNPYHAILTKFTGKELHRPRLKTPVNVWRKTRRAEIDDQVKKKYGTVKKSDLAAVRDKVAREMFGALSEEWQEHWRVQAKAEHERACNEWKEDADKGASDDPEDRQRCISGLVRFVQPFLDAICDATGWKATLIAGGPEPAQDGQLNVISINSGTTSGDVKMSFGHAERICIKKQLIPMFGSFLTKCYTPEECRACALPDNKKYQPIADSDFDHAVVSIFEVRPGGSNITSTTADPDTRLLDITQSVSPGDIMPPTISATTSQAPLTNPHSSSNDGRSAANGAHLATPVLIENERATLSSVTPFSSSDTENPFQYEFQSGSPAPSPAPDIRNVSPPLSPPHSRPTTPDNSAITLAVEPNHTVIAISEVSSTVPDIPSSNPNPSATILPPVTNTAEAVIPIPVVSGSRRSTRIAKNNENNSLNLSTVGIKGTKRKRALTDTTTAVNNQPAKRGRKAVKGKGHGLLF